MKIMRKCKYCGALLSETNSVFIYVSRYDDRGNHHQSYWICCKCWDDNRIQIPYYKLDQLPDPECTVKVKFKDNSSTCGNCNHLIFKDYKERTGSCRLTRLYRRFSDCCVHEEEMS